MTDTQKTQNLAAPTSLNFECLQKLYVNPLILYNHLLKHICTATILISVSQLLIWPRKNLIDSLQTNLDKALKIQYNGFNLFNIETTIVMKNLFGIIYGNRLQPIFQPKRLNNRRKPKMRRVN